MILTEEGFAKYAAPIATANLGIREDQDRRVVIDGKKLLLQRVELQSAIMTAGVLEAAAGRL